jgi:hypothetical protein
MADDEVKELLREILEVQRAHLDEYRQHAARTARALDQQDTALEGADRIIRHARLVGIIVIPLLLLALLFFAIGALFR